MSVAKYRKVHGKHGSGRFVVSEYPGPNCIYPLSWRNEQATPDSDDPLFEIIINHGLPLFEENNDQPQPDDGEHEDE